jgi:hypothetical protein
VFEDVAAVDKEIIMLEKSMELEVDQDDGDNLIQPNNRELTTEELQELDTFIEHVGVEEQQDQDNTMSTSEIKILFNYMGHCEENVQTFCHSINITVILQF